MEFLKSPPQQPTVASRYSPLPIYLAASVPPLCSPPSDRSPHDVSAVLRSPQQAPAQRRRPQLSVVLPSATPNPKRDNGTAADVEPLLILEEDSLLEEGDKQARTQVAQFDRSAASNKCADQLYASLNGSQCFAVPSPGNSSTTTSFCGRTVAAGTTEYVFDLD